MPTFKNSLSDRSFEMLEMTSFLVCPKCRGELAHSAAAFKCRNCAGEYPIVDDVPQFDLPKPPHAGESDRDERRKYWDLGWQARFGGDHAFLASLKSRADWSRFLESELKALGACRHVSVVEADRQVVQDKIVLDIGCGSGNSGAMFGYRGAHYIGIDHSRHAAAYALRHIRASGADGFTVQGNADALPIRDNSVDVVYSNGVLHHTPNFLTALDEAYRVLKPGGKAIIALYSTYSTQFGVTRLLGVLRGNLTPRAIQRWMGESTEGDWRTGDRLNPWTQTFSKAQLKAVVSKYNVHGLKIRKNGQPIGELPRFGSRLMRFRPIRKIDRALEPLLGGMLVMSFNK
jgi:ubiquinone/menaquinone biosynthesis C-methylase UbiE